MRKPLPGFEKRFEQIFRIHWGKESPTLNWFERLIGSNQKRTEILTAEMMRISLPSYETIGAPQVGRDKSADEWIKSIYLQSPQQCSEGDFFQQYIGYYVIDLAKEQEGVPVYQSAAQDKNSFRAQFLLDCKDLIGEHLINQAFESKFALDTHKYGLKLMSIADNIAKESNLQYLKEQTYPPEVPENSLESLLHIIFSASKWLVFYAKNGHGFEADF